MIHTCFSVNHLNTTLMLITSTVCYCHLGVLPDCKAQVANWKRMCTSKVQDLGSRISKAWC